MLRSTIPHNLGYFKTATLLSKPMPKKFGEELVRLFKQSNYDEVINKVENSAYRSHLSMRELVAICHQFLKEEHEDLQKRTQKQVAFLERMNRPKQ